MTRPFFVVYKKKNELFFVFLSLIRTFVTDFRINASKK